MYYLLNKSVNPYYNIALEEYIFSNAIFNDDVIIIWRNDKSIYMGKNQNPYTEVIHNLIESNKIPLIRRVSGGGTVYHDLGNINMSFIQKNRRLDQINFLDNTRFMQNLLKSLNLDVFISDRKDILLDGKKISGSAQCIKGKNALYHGTLLYESDLDNLNLFLNSKKTIKSSATKSVRSKVTNINDYLDMTIDNFLDYCVQYIKTNTDNAKEIILSKEDIKNIDELANKKYKSYNWTFESTPKFKIDIDVRNNLSVHVDIKKWKIIDFNLNINNEIIRLDKLIGEDFLQSKVNSIINKDYREYNEILNYLF